MKVGLDEVYDEKTGKKRKFTYSDVEYDADKWVDASKFLPADFDLVFIKSLSRKEAISGWSIGKKWDGLHIKPEEKILFWKKNDIIDTKV
jgi:hypothetical protein